MPRETYDARMRREAAEQAAAAAEVPALRARIVELEAQLEAARAPKKKTKEAPVAGGDA